MRYSPLVFCVTKHENRNLYIYIYIHTDDALRRGEVRRETEIPMRWRFERSWMPRFSFPRFYFSFYFHGFFHETKKIDTNFATIVIKIK